MTKKPIELLETDAELPLYKQVIEKVRDDIWRTFGRTPEQLGMDKDLKRIIEGPDRLKADELHVVIDKDN